MVKCFFDFVFWKKKLLRIDGNKEEKFVLGWKNYCIFIIIVDINVMIDRKLKRFMIMLIFRKWLERISCFY